MLFDVLSDQDLYRRFYRVVDIAVVLKRAVSRLESVSSPVEEIDNDFLQCEINQMLAASLASIRVKLHKKYVQSQKLTNETFDKYWLALEKMTYNIFVRNDGSDASHPELLKEYFVDMDSSSYRRDHRTHFEYMARVVKSYVKDQLRELL